MYRTSLVLSGATVACVFWFWPCFSGRAMHVEKNAWPLVAVGLLLSFLLIFEAYRFAERQRGRIELLAVVLLLGVAHALSTSFAGRAYLKAARQAAWLDRVHESVSETQGTRGGNK